MPITSSNDLILAGIENILEALRNPTPGSPTGPLTDIHVSTLKILSELITGLSSGPKPPLEGGHTPVSTVTTEGGPYCYTCWPNSYPCRRIYFSITDNPSTQTCAPS